MRSEERKCILTEMSYSNPCNSGLYSPDTKLPFSFPHFCFQSFNIFFLFLSNAP